MLKYLLKMLLVVMTAFFFTACGGDDDDDNNNNGGNPNQQGPATVADYRVDFIGPGGHSNGNYGRTSALHAAARAVMEVEKLCQQQNIQFYVREIHGGNSVNAMAGTGSFTVGLISGTSEANFESLVNQAAQKGKDDENLFRKVQPGDTEGTGASKVSLDIQVSPAVKL